MIEDSPLIPAQFESRPNRFVARVRIDGGTADAHLPNPGRMRELLVPGVAMYVRRNTRPGRKLRYDACLARYKGVWVGLVSHQANDLVDEALSQGRIPSLSDWAVKAREVRYGDSRVDFELRTRDHAVGVMTLEVKSCTLVENRHGLFPDAPTLRGARHVREAAERCRAGGRAAVLFCVQRSDCDVVSPNRETDPDFGAALDDASRAGVLLLAVRCRIGPRAMRVDREIRVSL